MSWNYTPEVDVPGTTGRVRVSFDATSLVSGHYAIARQNIAVIWSGMDSYGDSPESSDWESESPSDEFSSEG